MKKNMSIGELAKKSGSSVATIRYYEEIGLLVAANRTPSGHRIYGEETQQLLSTVRQCRSFGFSIDEIRELIAILNNPNRSCAETLHITEAHLSAVRLKLNELTALEKTLSELTSACASSCVGGSAVDCAIMEDRSSHAVTAAAKANCCGD